MANPVVDDGLSQLNVLVIFLGDLAQQIVLRGVLLNECVQLSDFLGLIEGVCVCIVE